jgi:hypothetical protein
MARIYNSKHTLVKGVNLRHISKVMDLWNSAINYYKLDSDTIKYTYTTATGMECFLHMNLYKDSVIFSMSAESKADFTNIRNVFFALKREKSLNRNTMEMLNSLYIKYRE